MYPEGQTEKMISLHPGSYVRAYPVTAHTVPLREKQTKICVKNG